MSLSLIPPRSPALSVTYIPVSLSHLYTTLPAKLALGTLRSKFRNSALAQFSSLSEKDAIDALRSLADNFQKNPLGTQPLPNQLADELAQRDVECFSFSDKSSGLV